VERRFATTLLNYFERLKLGEMPPYGPQLEHFLSRDPFDELDDGVSDLFSDGYGLLEGAEVKQADSLMPIRNFRKRPLLGQSWERTFRSSGTTSSQRSYSHYSAGGLKLYKANSMLAFIHAVNRILPLDNDQNLPCCYSFIPSSEDWPDSSLAQMVEWIGALLPVRYVRCDSFAEYKKAISREPSIILATGYHLASLFENQTPFRVHPNTVVMQTGGFKGKSFEYGVADFYQRLVDHFFLPSGQIIGEYGMCELASQAYAWGLGEDGEPVYKFPRWVKVRVAQGFNQIKNDGAGCLVVEDGMRVDVLKAIQVEDLVSVDGATFKLQGRLPKAPLKGCSLSFEHDGARVSSLDVSGNEGFGSKSRREQDRRSSMKNLDCMMSFVRRYFSSPEWLDALGQEFGSLTVARWAAEDFLNDLPQDVEAWQAAIHNSEVRKVNKPWLILPPSSHSMAALFPVLIGWAVNLDLSIRVPAHSAHLAALWHFIKSVRSYGCPIKLVASAVRFNCTASLAPYSGVTVYGSDVTCSKIRGISEIPTVSFGDYGKDMLLGGKELIKQNFDGLQKDILSLNGRGCLSLQRLFYVDRPEMDLRQFVEKLIRKLNEISFEKEHALISRLQREPILDYSVPSHTEILNIDGVIPILLCEQKALDEDVLHYLKNTGCYGNVLVVQAKQGGEEKSDAYFGFANRQKLDGRWFGKGCFEHD
jgi:hypothetical protein